MKVGMMILFSLILVVMFFYEWPKLQQKQGKEKKIFLLLLIINWTIATVLLFYPNTPGPTQFIQYIFKPLIPLL